jgi:biopolymer transport protein ExbB
MAWWNPDWSSRKALTVNTTSAGVDVATDLNDVPVLVRLHGGNFPQFLNVKDGGADFRFVAGDDQTPLKYHVEKFDAAAQIALVWVKLPVLKTHSADNKFYLYFGNQAANKADDAGGTYEADTAAVFHFADATGAVEDSSDYGTATTSALASTPTAGAVTPTPLSLLGMGGVLSGNEGVVVSDAPQLALTPDKGWAVSLWFKLDALPATTGTLLERGEGAQRLALTLSGGQLNASYGDVSLAASSPLVAGQWLHVALTVSADKLQLFVNGAPAGEAAAAVAPMSGATSIGAARDGKAALAMQIDELKFYGRARGADFFAAQAAIEGERNDRVVGYGADESQDSAGAEGEAHTTSQFGVIIDYVFGREEAIVEQAVIGVCILMAAIAVMVMFLKAVYLGRARRATNRFLSAYRTQTAGAGAALDALVSGTRSYGDSPLFSIYRQGIEQVRGRLEGSGASGLSDKSLGAIRATLDATAVREQQRLNSLLVLLTIAISGGPFIGLLGTVVGVMVTFATIAKTGDINIAAIAPGMAAALLATVAGLGVAIPALFGYNYLGSRAKELGADMQVFGDEFIAKVNEVHGV